MRAAGDSIGIACCFWIYFEELVFWQNVLPGRNFTQTDKYRILHKEAEGRFPDTGRDVLFLLQEK